MFAAVFVEQAGLPIPSVPFLIAMGALAGRGQFSFSKGLFLAVVACLLADSMWYELGRLRGHWLLSFLCRISLEPDSCVRRTEDNFARRGSRSLLFAKFIPGLGSAAPPIAGMLRMKRTLFASWDTLGSLLWASSFGVLGFIFSSQLERVAAAMARYGPLLAALPPGALAAYLGWKYHQRHRFIRSLRMARITPEELHRKLTAGENVVVVDLRHSYEFDADDVQVPGAIHLDPETLADYPLDIPPESEVVLYCT